MSRHANMLLVAGAILSAVMAPSARSEPPSPLHVGTAVAQLHADDSMVIAGGIGPRTVQGQEGELRATAIVLAEGATKLAIVSCDVLMLTRDLLDPVATEIESKCGIPSSNVMIHATHTHHAPSTIRVHAYERDAKFCAEVQQAIVQAVCAADEKRVPATFWFQHAEEATVGQNSRLMLADNTIYWVGSRDDAVRPTGPFDPDLPVLAFRDAAGKNLAVIFGHSTHTIGALTGNFRSPAFYGMAAQRMEQDLGGTFCFLEGASGSTHLLDGQAAEASQKIETAVRAALVAATEQVRPILTVRKRPLEFRVRTFDEQAEEKAVTDYCAKRIGGPAPGVIEVFRNMRAVLAPHQGELRTTWVQVIRIGDVAIVGVPAEFFTVLGVELKRRSPLPHTYIAELSNDWIGYLPDREGHQLGGYQVWTGFHSYAEPGTGERVVDLAVEMLREIAANQ